jgi:hypothetical protein
MPEIITAVSLILGLGVAMFAAWRLSANKTQTTSFQMLDAVIVSIIAFLLLGRLLGIVYYYQNFGDLGWALLPVTQPDTDILWLEHWPWAFFKFTDGFFLFTEAATAIISANVILSILHGRKYNLEEGKLSTVVFAVSLGLIPFALAMWYNRFLVADFQPALAVFNLALLVSGVVISRIFKKNNLVLALWMILIQFLTIVFLNVAATSQSKDLSGIYLVMAVFIAIGIFNLVATVGKMLRELGKQRIKQQAPYHGRQQYRTRQ